ncbi:MAG: M28 family peptidase [Rheinheimera sp.]|nr:MAG: M28 family peptidase [Rheinheimera sp.]
MALWFRRVGQLLAVGVVCVATLWPFYQVAQQQLTRAELARIDAQPGISRSSYQPRLDQLQQTADFSTLASGEMAGRRPGQPGSELARQFLQRRFTELGLIPAGTDGFAQKYQTDGQSDGVNFIGKINGTAAQLPAIVVTAHYDHVGVHQERMYPGADDNASGVAALLALAAYFQAHPPRHSLIFAAVDHEEQGMHGSKQLFAGKVLQPAQLALNVNLDMLSRDTKAQLFAVGTYQHPALLPLLQPLQQDSLVALRFGHDRPATLAGRVQDWSDASDHGNFAAEGVPFVYFGVPDHVDYHQPTDTFERADIGFYHKVSDTILSALLLLDQADLTALRQKTDRCQRGDKSELVK